MFGELLGLWAAAVWHQMGTPPHVRLIELGPGRGTMMLDMLRAAHVMPDFRKAAAVHLVETSPALLQRQKETLGKVDMPIVWHEALTEVPDGPAIIIANEFFDALPLQPDRQAGGWLARARRRGRPSGPSRLRGQSRAGEVFRADPAAQARTAEVGSIYEWRGDGYTLEVARRVVRGGGGALIIDYGHLESMVGDTFQAMRARRRSHPLAAPGFADVTGHVDFQALAQVAEGMGARVHGPIDQATLLRRLGIEKRACQSQEGRAARQGRVGRPRARPAHRRRQDRHGHHVQGDRPVGAAARESAGI